MSSIDFEKLLHQSKKSNSVLLEIVMRYQPLIRKNSYVNGVFDEDLHSELVLTLIKVIKKFEVQSA